MSEDLLGKWALMLINVSTRRFGRAVRLPEATFRRQGHRRVQVGGVAPVRGAVGGAHGGMDGGRPVELDLLIIQIDGIQIAKRT